MFYLYYHCIHNKLYKTKNFDPKTWDKRHVIPLMSNHTCPPPPMIYAALRHWMEVHVCHSYLTLVTVTLLDKHYNAACHVHYRTNIRKAT